MLPESRAQILVVDDETNLRRVLAAVLEREGYDVFVAADGREALGILDNHHVDLVVTDVRMPEVDGMTLLREVQRIDADIPVIMITAHSTVDNAVEALKGGAFDYLTKPFEQSDVKDVVRRALQTRRIAERETHRSSVVSVWEGSTVVGSSPAATTLMHSLEEAARRESHVLFIGERGTGKELLARTLHRVSSRQVAPFVKLHCETVGPELLGPELFGLPPTVFGGMPRPGKVELAADGTLFVEEVSVAAHDIQHRLAGLMHSGVFTRERDTVSKPASVRVMGSLRGHPGETPLAASLWSQFVTVLRVPPLRERMEDIPALCRYFVARYSERLSKAIDEVSSEVFELLSRYTWPGNLRELENVMEHAVLFCDGPRLGAHCLPALGPQVHDFSAVGAPSPGSLADVSKHGLKEQVREATSKLERDLINRALLETNGNVTHAARLLKISRKGLQLKMKELGLRERE